MKNPSTTAEPDTPGNQATVTALEISDPTAVGQAIELIEQDVVQLQSKPLTVRRVVVRLGSSVVLFQSTNLPVRTRTKLKEGHLAYVAFGPTAVGTLNGVPVGPDRVLASLANVEVEFVVEANYESLSFLVRPDDIKAHLRGRHREGEFRLPRGVELLAPGPTATRRLYRWGRRLIDMASRQPEVFDVPQTRLAAQFELFENLLETLSEVVQVESPPHELTRQSHSRVVRAAEDYALSHAAERFHVTELCEASGVSERTLQYAFQELFGMTPVAYLNRLRLHRVRQALRQATHAQTTVTKQALHWGFWHFGDFSRAYRDCFGELPSDTLRRVPDVKE